MKHLARILRLSVLALLCGCGGGGGNSSPPPQGLKITGNWQFSTTSAVPGVPPATIAGSIAQSGSSVTGAVHIDGSNCFDQLTTIGLTGSLTGNSLSLTSTAVDGQVITFTGIATNNALTGTYAINGGCASGDQGSLNGFTIPAISGRWRGRTIVNDQTGNLTVTLTQGNANADASSGLSGSTSDATYFVCDEGTIASGTLTTPGSWIIGTQVFLQIQTANGRVDFSGTVDQAGSPIRGGLKYVDGPCDGFFGEATFNR